MLTIFVLVPPKWTSFGPWVHVPVCPPQSLSNHCAGSSSEFHGATFLCVWTIIAALQLRFGHCFGLGLSKPPTQF
jgi:hypothetical protein